MPSPREEQALTTNLWERVVGLLPAERLKPKGGRPRAEDRACLFGIVSVLRWGCRWRDLPPHFPSPATCWRRHAQWTAQGIWEQVWREVLKELQEVRVLETDELCLDATFIPSQKGGTK